MGLCYNVELSSLVQIQWDKSAHLNQADRGIGGIGGIVETRNTGETNILFFMFKNI